MFRSFSGNNSEDAGDLLRDIKSELLPEEVFAFTPKGDVINRPAGATVIDFAYAIHSAAVSYTHLDVYKRQAQRQAQQEAGARRQAQPARPEPAGVLLSLIHI